MPSKWVRVLPWYYTARKRVGRHNAKRDAILSDLRDGDSRLTRFANRSARPY
jgi:hypothetical protein